MLQFLLVSVGSIDNVSQSDDMIYEDLSQEYPLTDL